VQQQQQRCGKPHAAERDKKKLKQPRRTALKITTEFQFYSPSFRPVIDDDRRTSKRARIDEFRK
jgi:hypothetical protein